MKRIVFMILSAALLVAQPVYAAEEAPYISARSAIVYHADSGRVLFEKQSEKKMLIASTTKIMTGLLAVEMCSLDDRVTITEEMANVEGSSMYLKVGETYTLRELLYGLLLASGNDAATAIALHVAGNEASFAALMNRKAYELGMVHTCFENPHGLDGENHYSTAEDMAILAAYAMKNQTFAEIVGTRNITIKDLTYVNHNKLLWQCDGVVGIKTGYTKAAGRTLVTCCQRNGQKLVCVTLSASDDWNDHKKLYDWAYASYQEHLVLSKDTVYQIPIMSGTDATVSVKPLTDVTVFADENSEIEYIVELPRFVFGTIVRGEAAGRVVVFVDGIETTAVQLIYMEDFTMNIETPFSLDQLFHGVKEI